MESTKIDFSAKPWIGKKKIYYKNELAPSTTQEIIHLLQKHYAQLLGILRLHSFNKYYIMRVSSTNKGPLSSYQRHYSPQLGIITINKKTFLEASSLINNYHNVNEEDSINLIYLIRNLAHEMYHMRQACIYKESYIKRTQNYILPTNDRIGYYKQLLEVGARIFASQYIKWLFNNLKPEDSSPLAISLRNYFNSAFTPEEIQKLTLKLIQLSNASANMQKTSGIFMES